MPTMYTVLYSKYLNQFKEAKCLHMRRYSLNTSRVLSCLLVWKKLGASRIAKKKKKKKKTISIIIESSTRKNPR